MTRFASATGSNKTGTIPDIAKAQATAPIPANAGRVSAVLAGAHGAVALDLATLRALEALAGADRYKSRPDKWTHAGRANISISQMRTLAHHGFASTFEIPGSGRFAKATALAKAELDAHDARKRQRKRS
jgi:hypothetical protein